MWPLEEAEGSLVLNVQWVSIGLLINCLYWREWLSVCSGVDLAVSFLQHDSL